MKPARPGPTMVNCEATPTTVPTKLVLMAWLMVTAPPVLKFNSAPAEPLTPAMELWPLWWRVILSPKVTAAKEAPAVR